MVSFKSIGEKKFSTFFEKTTELEFLRWLWAVAPKRSIGWENGGQIRIQREILHRYGEFERNRREKFSLTSPCAKLPILLLVDGFCRAIARFKAKSKTNLLKETACLYLSSFICETPFKSLGDWRKTTVLEFWTGL